MGKISKDVILINIVAITTFGYILLSFVNKSFIEYSNLALSGLLVLLTAAYTVFTKRIILENQKDRKIAHIEKQLEKLYYPLKDHIQSDRIQSLKNFDNYCAQRCHRIEEPMQTFDEIVPYIYLATSKMKKSLEDFIIFMRYKPQEAMSEYAGKAETKDKIDSLEKLLDEDIQELKRKLDELHNSE